MRFPSIWELAQASIVLLDLAACAGVPGAGVQVVGKCFDFEKWFRQLPMSNLDCWQNVEAWRGTWYFDKRVAMGCCRSSNTGQRVSLVVLSIVGKALDEGLDAFLSSLDAGLAARIRRWMGHRLAVFGTVAQARPWHIGSYQDDSPIQTIALLAGWVNRVFLDTLRRLRVPVADKCAANPFMEKFDAIGGEFDCSQGGRCVGPTAATMVKFRGGIDQLGRGVATGGDVDFDDFDAFVGVLEWVCRFLPDGVLGLVEAHRRRRIARARRKRASGRAKPGVAVDLQFVQSIEQVWQALVERKFRSWTSDPVVWHGGERVAADASTADEWGLHVGRFFAYGAWEEATLAAIRNSKRKRADRERVSISPLELLAQVLLLVVAMRTHGSPPNGQLVMSCDNSSAIDVVETRRPRSPAMRRALLWLTRVEGHFRVRVRLAKIPSEKNKAADALSHLRVVEAVEHLRERRLQPVEFDMREPVFDGLSLEALARVMQVDVRGALLECDRELA